MAHGFKKPLLMLAEDNLLAPVDYREYLKNYNKTSEALNYLDEWLKPVEQVLKTKQDATKIQNSARLAADLKNLQFGEHVAENEVERLVEEYFIPTAEYEDAVEGSRTVFVGRKGSGKTANLMKLEDELGKGKQNLVCVIMPQDYQMQGIVDLLKRYQHRNVKGHAIESLWKFLLLTEIAKIAFENLVNAPAHPMDEVEQSFYDFVTKNETIICTEFSTRLEACARNLNQTVADSNNENSYLPVAEALHSSILKQLRVELGKLLSRKQRIAILVDNLDQAWDVKDDIKSLSEILWRLLEVAKQLPVELRKQDSRRKGIKLSLAIFLRFDIFYRIREVAREPDKMPCSLLNWDDTEMLCRIIEERFSSSFESIPDPSDLWEQYFCPNVNGIPTKDYITSVILKRPRDIIYLVNEAVTTAINRKHTQIEQDDIFDAERKYSQFAIGIVNIENTLPNINLKDVIFEFAGMPAVLSKSQVLNTLKNAEISADMIQPLIDVLHELTFLGLETEQGKFVFSNAPDESQKNMILARRFAERNGHEERFQIHKAFRAFLETEEI